MNTIHYLETLSHEEVCALHLSSLVDVASEEHDRSSSGLLISYDDDLLSKNVNDVMVDVILPYLGLQDDIDTLLSSSSSTTTEDNNIIIVDRIADILAVRSNTAHIGSSSSRGGGSKVRDDKMWYGVGEEWDLIVSTEVSEASKVYMTESMDGIARFVNMEMMNVKMNGR